MTAKRYRNAFCTVFTQTIGKIRTPQELVDLNDGITFCRRSPLELTQTGKPHYHYYIETSGVHNLHWYKAALANSTANVQMRRGSQHEALTYCTGGHYNKTRGKYKHQYTLVDSNEQPMDCGELKKQGARGDLDAVADAISIGTSWMSLQETYPRQTILYRRNLMERKRDYDRKKYHMSKRSVETTVLIGDTGTGKTHYAWVKAEEGKRIVEPIWNGKKYWFESYDHDEQDILLLDEFKGDCGIETFLKLTDIYVRNWEVKCSSSVGRWKEVIITSNIPIKEWFNGWEGIDKRHVNAFSRRITKIFNLPKPKAIKLETLDDLLARAEVLVLPSATSVHRENIFSVTDKSLCNASKICKAKTSSQRTQEGGRPQNVDTSDAH